jgi:hypothetical protein
MLERYAQRREAKQAQLAQQQAARNAELSQVPMASAPTMTPTANQPFYLNNPGAPLTQGWGQDNSNWNQTSINRGDGWQQPQPQPPPAWMNRVRQFGNFLSR